MGTEEKNRLRGRGGGPPQGGGQGEHERSKIRKTFGGLRTGRKGVAAGEAREV